MGEQPGWPGGAADTVWLTVPPSSPYLRTVRLVAADAAVRSGLDCEEIEDFRIAIDELCHLLMASTDDFIELRLVTFDDRVVAYGQAKSRVTTGPHTLGTLSELILSSTADHYAVDSVDGGMRFEVVKQSRQVLADRR